MERYTVTVYPPEGQPCRLLIPFSPKSTISALAIEIKRRISRLDIWNDVSNITLRLGEANGPILDEEDLLEDVILDAKAEIIVVTSQAQAEPAATLQHEVGPNSNHSSHF